MPLTPEEFMNVKKNTIAREAEILSQLERSIQINKDLAQQIEQLTRQKDILTNRLIELEKEMENGTRMEQ